MSFNYSPRVVNDSSLVMCLDAANTKSLADVPSRNLFRYSEDFTSTWVQNFSTISSSTILAPFGSSSGSTLFATSGFSNLGQTIIVPIGIYTTSYYVKYINQQFITIVHQGDPYAPVTFDLINGTKGTIGGTSGFGVGASITSVSNGWYRISLTVNVTTSDFALSPLLWFGLYNGTNNVGSQVYVWGAQLESGYVATTYIPTTTVGVSRIPTWADISKGGNNGTLTSGLTYNYSNGGSLVFDPTTSGYTQVDSTILNDSGGTINAWYKPLDVPPSGFTAYIFAAFGTYEDRFYLSMGNNRGITVSRGNPRISINAGNKPLNVWYNLTMTWDSTTFSGYLNGIQFGNTTSYTASGTVTTFIIGGYTFPLGTQIFNGYISQVSIYNRALSASEVLQNYNAVKGRFGL